MRPQTLRHVSWSGGILLSTGANAIAAGSQLLGVPGGGSNGIALGAGLIRPELFELCVSTVALALEAATFRWTSTVEASIRLWRSRNATLNSVATVEACDPLTPVLVGLGDYRIPLSIPLDEGDAIYCVARWPATTAIITAGTYPLVVSVMGSLSFQP